MWPEEAEGRVVGRLGRVQKAVAGCLRSLPLALVGCVGGPLALASCLFEGRTILSRPSAQVGPCLFLVLRLARAEARVQPCLARVRCTACCCTACSDPWCSDPWCSDPAMILERHRRDDAHGFRQPRAVPARLLLRAGCAVARVGREELLKAESNLGGTPWRATITERQLR